MSFAVGDPVQFGHALGIVVSTGEELEERGPRHLLLVAIDGEGTMWIDPAHLRPGARGAREAGAAVSESDGPPPPSEDSSALERDGTRKKLAVAGIIAPVLRENAAKLKARHVKLWNQGTGEVTGHTTGDVVVQAMVQRAGLELAVQDGKRPAYSFCKQCGKTISVPKERGLRVFCSKRCRRVNEREATRSACPEDGCTNESRKGRRCRSCAVKLRNATTDTRAKISVGRKRHWASMTPKQRKEILERIQRKGAAAMKRKWSEMSLHERRRIMSERRRRPPA